MILLLNPRTCASSPSSTVVRLWLATLPFVTGCGGVAPPDLVDCSEEAMLGRASAELAAPVRVESWQQTHQCDGELDVTDGNGKGWIYCCASSPSWLW